MLKKKRMDISSQLFVVDSLGACAVVFAKEVQCSSEAKSGGLTAGGTCKIQRYVHIQTYRIMAGVNSRVRDGTYNLLSMCASVTGGH